MEKMLVKSIISFSHMFSTLSKTEIIIYITFILPSANAFLLDKVKILSSGNGFRTSVFYHNGTIWDWTWNIRVKTKIYTAQARIQISFSGGGGVPPKMHSSYYMILWFQDFNGCKPFTRKVNISSSNHEDVSTFRTFFFFMTVFYINAVQYQTSTISRIR